MEEIVVRPRYSRRNHDVRRKRHNNIKEKTLLEKIVLQVLVCILILITLGIIKNINTPFCEYLNSGVNKLLSYDFKLTDINNSFDPLLNKVKAFSIYKSKENPDAIETTNQDVEENILSTEESQKEQISFTKPIDGKIVAEFTVNSNNEMDSTIYIHSGVDFEVDKDMEVLAVLSGEITEVGESEEYGKYIKIKHDDGLETLYGHCQEIQKQVGQKVEKGEVLGMVLREVYSIPPHLHFEVYKNKEIVDPMSFFNDNLKS